MREEPHIPLEQETPKKTKRKGPNVLEVNRLYKNGLVLLVVKQRPVPAETAGRPWMKTNTPK